MVSGTVRVAWKLVLAADVGVLLYGLMAVSDPSIFGAGFQTYTGQDWSALQTASPRVGEYVALLVRVIGGLNIGIAVAAIAMILAGLRSGQAWSWYGLLAVNTIGFGTPIAFDLTVGSIGIFERLEQILILLVYVALALCAKDVLRRKATVP